MKRLGQDVPPSQLNKVFKDIDTDGTGDIGWDEFVAMVSIPGAAFVSSAEAVIARIVQRCQGP